MRPSMRSGRPSTQMPPLLPNGPGKRTPEPMVSSGMARSAKVSVVRADSSSTVSNAPSTPSCRPWPAR
ncbi:MAG: hypothetical protein U1F43_19430 [Myxococcota bacterium]